MALRQPKRYENLRPAYNELSEGQRPTFNRYPIIPYHRLPIFDMDNKQEWPIVLPAGTVIGLKSDGGATGPSGCSGTSDGSVVPAVTNFMAYPGAGATSYVNVGSTHTSDETDFNMSIAGWQAPVYPIGVTFKPHYAFNPRSQDVNASINADARTLYTNNKMEHAISFVTEWVIEIPARTPFEHSIRPGDTVIPSTYLHWNNDQTVGSYTLGSAGTFMALDSLATSSFTGGLFANASTSGALISEVGNAVLRSFILGNLIMGKCLGVTLLGSHVSATQGTFLSTSLTNGQFTRAPRTLVPSTDGAQFNATDEFGRLDLVQTFPGHIHSGSESEGILDNMAGTFGARADSSGYFRMLKILLRVV